MTYLNLRGGEGQCLDLDLSPLRLNAANSCREM